MSRARRRRCNHNFWASEELRQVLPGDGLWVRWGWDTAQGPARRRQHGDGTDDEMCFVGILYYLRLEDEGALTYPCGVLAPTEEKRFLY